MAPSAPIGWILLLALVTPAIADEPTPEEAECGRLRGTWKLVGAEEAGRVIAPERLQDQTLTLEARRYFVKRGDEIEEQGTFSLDPETMPRAIDLKIQKGADEGKTQPGIYTLDGETLRIAFGKPGAKQRPRAFATSGDGAALFVMTLKRQRK